MSESWKTVEELLAVPERWTKLCSARDASGTAKPPDDLEAVCWCVLGAIDRVYGTSGPKRFDVRGQLAKVAKCGGAAFLDDWNDSIDHATMIAAVRKAGV